MPELLIPKAKFTLKRDTKMAPFLISCVLLMCVHPRGMFSLRGVGTLDVGKVKHRYCIFLLGDEAFNTVSDIYRS